MEDFGSDLAVPEFFLHCCQKGRCDRQCLNTSITFSFCMPMRKATHNFAVKLGPGHEIKFVVVHDGRIVPGSGYNGKMFLGLMGGKGVAVKATGGRPLASLGVHCLLGCQVRSGSRGLSRDPGTPPSPPREHRSPARKTEDDWSFYIPRWQTFTAKSTCARAEGFLLKDDCNTPC